MVPSSIVSYASGPRSTHTQWYFSGCPNQEIGWPFPFEGLVIGTSSYFAADCEATIKNCTHPFGAPSRILICQIIHACSTIKGLIIGKSSCLGADSATKKHCCPSSTWAAWNVDVQLIPVLFSGRPNQEMWWPFLLNGVIIGTSFCFFADSATMKNTGWFIPVSNFMRLLPRVCSHKHFCSVCPNQGLGSPFLFKGPVKGSYSFIGVDSAIYTKNWPKKGLLDAPMNRLIIESTFKTRLSTTICFLCFQGTMGSPR
jgi:hypothetical protein